MATRCVLQDDFAALINETLSTTNDCESTNGASVTAMDSLPTKRRLIWLRDAKAFGTVSASGQPRKCSDLALTAAGCI
jgi:hypothetical protein